MLILVLVAGALVLLYFMIIKFMPEEQTPLTAGQWQTRQGIIGGI